MNPVVGIIKRARVVAVAVIGGALLIVGCDGTLTGGGPETLESEPVGVLDGSVGDDVVEEGSEYAARADAGVDDPRLHDPVQPADPCGRCGNGAVDCKESCDDGDQVAERCADPRVHPEADRFARVCGNNCRWTICRVPYCGDEIVDLAAEEQCDEGESTRTCTRGCQLTACGREANLEAFVDDYECDGTVDGDDNCPRSHNPDQADADNDGVGDACEPVGECTNSLCGPPQVGGCGASSILITHYEPGDIYYVGDSDSDSQVDELDNCPLDYNPSQADSDLDGVGDRCDPQVCPTVCR